MFENYPETIQLITKFTVESLQVESSVKCFDLLLCLDYHFGYFTGVAVRAEQRSLFIKFMATDGCFCALR